MPGEAKLGIILGVGVVLTVALVFYKPERNPEVPGNTRATTAPNAVSLSPMRPAALPSSVQGNIP